MARPPLERVIREALGIPAQYVDNEHDVPSAVVQLVANELNDDLGAPRPSSYESLALQDSEPSRMSLARDIGCRTALQRRPSP